MSCGVFGKLTVSCWCCLTCSSRFLQTVSPLIKIPGSCDILNPGLSLMCHPDLCWDNAVQVLLCHFIYSNKLWASLCKYSPHMCRLDPPTCVLVPVLLVYLGPFEMPAGQDRTVSFISHPQSWLKLLVYFHLAGRWSFSGHKWSHWRSVPFLYRISFVIWHRHHSMQG